MIRGLLVLVALLSLAASARAARNEGGAMVVHTNDSYNYTSQTACIQSFGGCGELNTVATRTQGQVVWLLAAFPGDSDPAVTVVHFGIDHSPDLDPGTAYRLCGPGGSIEVPDADWPYSGRGNSVAFGSPVSGQVLFPFYVFRIDGGAPGAFFRSGPNPTGGYAAFVDDGTPPVQDVCTQFGTVRWFDAGGNECPGAPPPTGACCVGTQCFVRSPAGCDSLAGGYQGDDTVCDPDPCAVACCFPGGNCTVLTREQCLNDEGSYEGFGTVCDPNPCPPEGACCTFLGFCLQLTEAYCAGQGLWLGAGSDCETEPCPPLGACCAEDGTCTLSFAAFCEDPSVWIGPDVPCDPNPCPPSGACCQFFGGCVILTEAHCSDEGFWQGAGTDCDPHPCPPPGACCAGDGTCSYVLEARCTGDQVWLGSETVCQPNPCGETGACCLGGGECRLWVRPLCEDRQGTFRGEGTVCGEGSCPAACCLVDGGCEVLLPADCLERGGASEGYGYSCDPSPCPVLGACCTFTGECLMLTQSDCTPLGTWQGTDSLCDSDPCPPMGACCLDDGGCSYTTQAGCDRPGVWMGNDVPCTPNPCTAACCFSDGTCDVRPRAECVSAGGDPGDQGSSCTPNPCPPARACCTFEGPCVVLTESACANRGTWHQESPDCDPDPCPPSGACCYDDGECSFVLEAVCSDGGIWLGPQTACDPNPCGPSGACCLQGGLCQPLIQRWCEEQEGVFLGAGSVCDPNPCPVACCFDDGRCELKSPASCLDAGGTHEGHGPVCEPDPCPASGACCFEDGSCSTLTSGACARVQGTYEGNGTECVPNRCPQPGACCLEEGACEPRVRASCERQGGVFQGEGTGCDPNPCPGACCFVDGTCALMTTTDCAAEGGAHEGYGYACDPDPCPRAGACCFDDGSCLLRTAVACAAASGSYRGDGTSCAPNPCPQPGACCLEGGECRLLTPAVCEREGGAHQGEGVPCDPNPCPVACCFEDGRCDLMSTVACEAGGGTYEGHGYACDPNPCPRAGACCFDDGSCLNRTAVACAAAGGVYGGGGTSCAPNPCPQPGACCLIDSRCVFISRADCTSEAGKYAGDGTPCNPDPCEDIVGDPTVVPGEGTQDYRWEVRSDGPIDSLGAWFRRGGDSEYRSTGAFTREGQNLWVADLAAEDVTLRGIEAHIAYRTTLGVRLEHGSASAPIRLSVTGSLQVPMAEPFAYRMVAAPMLVSARQDVWSLLEASFGPSGRTSWMIGRWSPADTEYVELGPDVRSAFEPGAAYWMAFSAPGDWSLGGEANYPDRESSAFAIRLRRGWNMVGNPAAYRVPSDATDLRVVNSRGDTLRYEDAVVSRLVSLPYVYDPVTAPSESAPYSIGPASLDVWQGCWIHNAAASDLTLLIPAVEHRPERGRVQSLSDASEDPDWSLSLTAQCGTEVSGVRLGVVTGQRRDAGTVDCALPPAAPGRRLRFGARADSGTEGGSSSALLVRQYGESTGPSTRWILILDSPSGEVLLRWSETPGGELAPGDQEAGGGTTLTLRDLGGGRRYDLRTVRSLTIPAGAHAFEVIREVGAAPPATGVDFSLSAIPNPLRNETELRICTPFDGDIFLALIDPKGARIFRKEERQARPGEHVVIWNGTNQRGARVPAGVYFARLRFVPASGQVGSDGMRQAVLKLSVMP